MTSRSMLGMILIGLVTSQAAPVAAAEGSPAGAPPKPLVELVERVRRADYEGDRAALRTLHEQLKPYAAEPGLASRVEYWRGFALWRRAINGFNENADSTEQSVDLTEAVQDFLASSAADTTFLDARIGAFGSQGLLMYLNNRNPARIQELAPRTIGWLKELRATAGDHPRFLWVEGPLLFAWPPERGGGQEKAIGNYRRGLEAIRTLNATPAGPLEPTWGEPELLMNLAWSALNQTAPDLDAAQQNAEAALKLVPYWHYTRDILMPQIREAREKSAR